MTCIIGMEHKGTVYAGSDSWIGDGDDQYVLDNSKFLRYPSFTLAFAGSMRGAQIIETEACFRRIRKSEDERKYLITHVCEEIKRSLIAKGFQRLDKDDMDLQLLVFTQTKVRMMQEDYSLIRDRSGCMGAGSGSLCAIGALRAFQQTGLEPEEAMRKSFEIAESLHTGICGPYYISKI
jgi:ATP-dependent protease HslVU (ClpYQ) peptidase subunit